jgi:uncharacterized protein YbaR (Trm112 family)
MFQSQLVKFLRCPFTHSPLALASAAQLKLLNASIEARQVTTRLHRIQEQPLQAALLNSDHSWALAIHDDIPNLNPDAALSLKGLALDTAQLDEGHSHPSPVKE